MAPAKLHAADELAEKRSFFTELRALNDSSGDEKDENDASRVLSRCKKGVPISSSPSSLPPISVRGASELSTLAKSPGLFRANSAPIRGNSDSKEILRFQRQSGLRFSETAKLPERRHSKQIPVLTNDGDMVQETPEPVLRKNSLLINDMTPVPEVLVIKETPQCHSTKDLTTSSRPQERRTVSSPVIGCTSLALPYKTYSTGIQEMLGKKKVISRTDTMPPKKKARKASKAEIKPPQHLIGMIFYYVPPDDKAKHRKIRITNATKYGAIWTKDITDATHIVAESDHHYENVMKHLKLDVLPEGMILVNDRYTGECIQHGMLVSPAQDIYAVTGYKEALAALEHAIQTSADVPPDTTKADFQFSGSIRSSFSENSEQVPTESIATAQSLTSLVESAPQTHWYGDELDEMIKVAQKMKNIPFDEGNEDGESRPPSRGDEPETSESENERPSSRGSKRKRKGSGFAKEQFQCMTGGTAGAMESNPNAYTLEVLQEMRDIYARLNNQWRELAYRRAIGTLKKQSTLISTYDQAISLPCIAHRLAEKIVEIVTTGRLRKLEFAKLEPSDQILQLFMKIYGVGISQASKWVQQGHKSLEDLKEKVQLTEHQRMGIDHYDDLQTPIPRDEVTSLGDFVKNVAADIDPAVRMIIGGSYRRGALMSGDIDCLFTKDGTISSKDLLPFLSELVDRLTAVSFLVHAVAVPSEHGSGSKWHGCCVLPGTERPIWRRIDLLLVPETELGAALIYFTGDDIFNRSLRLLASKSNMRLNQRGLYKEVMRGRDRAKVTEGTLIEGADEEKIFAILGVPWRPPEHRILH